MALAQIQELRVRGDMKRLFLEIIEFLIHLLSAAPCTLLLLTFRHEAAIKKLSSILSTICFNRAMGTAKSQRWRIFFADTDKTSAGMGENHRMANVKVYIVGKDRKVGAMVKALAREIAGFQPVRGATKEFLTTHGYYLFDFPSASGATELKEAVRKYLPASLATIEE